jgi:hypothetical protein
LDFQSPLAGMLLELPVRNQVEGSAAELPVLLAVSGAHTTHAAEPFRMHKSQMCCD